MNRLDFIKSLGLGVAGVAVGSGAIEAVKAVEERVVRERKEIDIAVNTVAIGHYTPSNVWLNTPESAGWICLSWMEKWYNKSNRKKEVPVQEIKDRMEELYNCYSFSKQPDSYRSPVHWVKGLALGMHLLGKESEYYQFYDELNQYPTGKFTQKELKELTSFRLQVA